MDQDWDNALVSRGQVIIPAFTAILDRLPLPFPCPSPTIERLRYDAVYHQ